MKTRLFTSLLTGLLLLLTTVVLPRGNDKDMSSNEEVNALIVEKAPLKGLDSHDEDLRFKCAYRLGEIKDGNCCIELMRLLRNDPSEAVRIVAALSLIKIGNPIGVHLVKGEAKFNDSEKVRNFCHKFYIAYAYNKILAEKEDALTEIKLTAEN